MSTAEVYEIYAIKYAEKLERYRRDNFLLADDHDAPMPMDYFVWALVGAEHTIVVDTGFDHAEGARRGRDVLRRPAEALALIGVDAATVPDVVITHLHYDHAGTLEDFPAARFHVNALEMTFATGRHMVHPAIRRSYTADHVCAMVQRLFRGRVAFVHDAAPVAPGVSVHHIGGHTMGMQSVRVHTRRGWVVVASDAAHYYENFEQRRPYPTVYDVGDMIAGWDTLARLADSPAHIVPGHDPDVFRRYAAPHPDLEGIAVRLDLAPRS